MSDDGKRTQIAGAMLTMEMAYRAVMSAEPKKSEKSEENTGKYSMNPVEAAIMRAKV